MSPPGRVPISVVIAAKDEAGQIADCVASVAWAAEILVVENDSADDTVARARAAGATVFAHPFTTIGAQRNAAIARAAEEWVLVVDADERASPALAAEIAALVAGAPGHDAYRVPRDNYFLGRRIRHGGWERDRPIRLFRRALRYDASRVHERVVTDAPAGALGATLAHHPYRSLDQYFEKFVRYARWWAAEHHARGRRASAATVALRPPVRFVTMYVVRGGWRDGAHGVILAVLAAMSVAAKYACLWALGRSAPDGG